MGLDADDAHLQAESCELDALTLGRQRPDSGRSDLSTKESRREIGQDEVHSDHFEEN